MSGWRPPAFLIDHVTAQILSSLNLTDQLHNGVRQAIVKGVKVPTQPVNTD